MHRVRCQSRHCWRGADVGAVCEEESMDRRWGSDSGGHQEKRYVVVTAVALGGHTWPIEVTLTDRESMLFRMLLGRTALNRRFTIDVGKSYCLGPPPAPESVPETDR